MPCGITTRQKFPKGYKGFKPYRKKPIVIWAAQMDRPFTTKTMEGKLKGKAGDYLVVGVKGEHYPCDKKIFEETYDEVKVGAER